MTLIFAFIIAPLLVIVWASFFSDRILTFPPSGYTLSWFARAWALQDFASGFTTSLEVGVCATLGSLLLGVPAALAIERFPFPGRETVRHLLLSPMYVPAIVAGAAVYIYFVQIEILSGVQFAATFHGLVIAHTLVALPWTMRLVCASLMTANAVPEEAARSLGANALQTFFLVTLPTIRPGMIAAAMFAFIASFSDLEKSLFLVGPGVTTLPISILNYLEWNLDSTIAAVATVQIAIIGAALLISDRFVNLGKAF
ncbi:ABC transporter permease [Polaromonas sp. C04]|uniref:ABC transporter permease n=1 Tax=Polaromonas sp. C04 TaxID=1945857 RepID=UPI001C2B97B0|nr:ABC transporter permease [Polaromonas sp. C04]